MTDAEFTLEPDAVTAHLLESACRAPSAHNTQPWVLQFGDSSVDIGFDDLRRIPVIDPTDVDLKHAIGVVLENLLLTLSRLGLQGDYEVADEWSPDNWIVTLHWKPREDSATATELELERMIPIRSTSRLPYLLERADEALLAQLTAATESPCMLHILTDQLRVDRIRKLTARATAMQLANGPIATELFDWLRFSDRDPGWFRDGLNADCMGFKWWEAPIARMLTHPTTLQFGKWIGLPKLLCASVNQQAPPTPTLCLLTTQDDSLRGRIEAGRVLQRTWLTAATEHYFTHPLSAAIEMPELREAVLDQFDLPRDTIHVNMFRLGRSAQPARSARLPADELVM